MTATTTDVSWYNALTLAERAPLARRLAPAPHPGTDADDLAERWRGRDLFADLAAFRRRLAAEGLDDAIFEATLALPGDGLRQAIDEDPAWLSDLIRCVGTSAAASGSLPRLFADRARESVPLLKLVEPLMADAYGRLLAAIDELASGESDVPFDTGILEILFGNLPGRLAMILRRTMVLELNVARMSGDLVGETPQERFQSFIERLEQPEVRRQLLAEYPVLARQVMQRVDQWRTFNYDFLRHLRDDWKTLRKTFWPAPEAPPSTEAVKLVEAQAGLGDSHCGGRSVITTRFSDGRRLIYKPRSLAVEQRFNDLLRWLNDKGFDPAFRTLTVEDRGDHGWVEFVEKRGCADEGEVRRFYQRQGGYLALLYALNASDFHFENVIASGEHPVLVDLETLFHPRITDGDATPHALKLGEVLRRSVLGPGLLPNRFRSNPDKEEGVDLSGLSPVAGQETWKPVLGIEAPGTDEMRFAYSMGTFPDTHHHPTLGDSEITAADYAEEICEGFSRCYRLLIESRDELLAENGPIRAFADAEVRVIFRATLSYSLLLSESFHPDVLRDALERDLLFDRLWKTVADQPHMARVVAAEQQDLRQVDIPIFTTRPDSRDVWTSRHERLRDYFAESGLSMVERTLAGLGEADLERQAWLVRSTLGTLSYARAGSGEAKRSDRCSADVLAPAERTASSEELLRGADGVARRLRGLAWSQGGQASWFTYRFLSGRHWNVQPAPPDLYNGLAGIALFLAYHGAVRSHAGSSEFARQALRTLRGDLEASPDLLPVVGAMNGWGGLVYTYVHLAALWSEPDWLDEAEEIVWGLGEQVDRDCSHDIVAGAAGCLVALLELYEKRPTAPVLATAVRCGERLLAQARTLENGYGWVLEEAGETPLAGFSHGAAGIAWALFRLAAVTGDRRYHDVALGGVAYERGVFSEVEQNWPDLRGGARPEEADAPGHDGHHFLTAWCHGAPGIALGRLLSLPYLDDAESRREIEIGLETTRRDGFGKSDCLCHGNLGNLDVMLLASEVLGDDALRRETGRRAASLLSRAGQAGWSYGIPGGMTPPGLMVGLAGFGYQLLRLAAPKRVPSILALAPPPESALRAERTAPDAAFAD